MGACYTLPYDEDDDNFNYSLFFVNNHHLLNEKDRVFYTDYNLVYHLVKNDWFNLMYVDPNLNNYSNIIRLALEQDGMALQFVPIEKRTKKTVLLAVRQNGNALMFAPHELQDDDEVVSAAVAQDPYAIKLASDRLKGDKKLVLSVVSKNGFALSCVSQALRTDEDVITTAVGNQKKAEIYAIKKPTNVGYVHPFLNNQPPKVA